VSLALVKNGMMRVVLDEGHPQPGWVPIPPRSPIGTAVQSGRASEATTVEDSNGKTAKVCRIWMPLQPDPGGGEAQPCAVLGVLEMVHYLTPPLRDGASIVASSLVQAFSTLASHALALQAERQHSERLIQRATAMADAATCEWDGDAAQACRQLCTAAEQYLAAQVATLFWVRQSESGQYLVHGADNSVTIPSNKGIMGCVAERKLPLNIANAHKDSRYHPRYDRQASTVFEADKHDTRSILSVPIILQDRVVGVLQVTNRLDGMIFDDEDTSSLMVFTDYVARSLAKSNVITLSTQT